MLINKHQNFLSQTAPGSFSLHKQRKPIMVKRTYNNLTSRQYLAKLSNMGNGFVNAIAALDLGLIFG